MGTVVTKKAKKRVWAILLTFMLLIGLTLTAVFAASTTKLEIGGIDILTAPNYTVACGEGTAVYDPNQNTLTLNQATIEYSSGNMAGIYTTKEDLTIILKGENKISSVCFGIFGGKTLKMQGDGMLTVESAKDSIYADDITLDNTTVSLASQEGTAIFGSAQIKIKNGSNITATAKTTAIQGNAGVQISQSSIHAMSANGKALYSDGVIGIENHSQLIATGNHDTVWGDTDVEIYDSKIDLTATNSGTAIYSNQGDTTIERSLVKVNAPDDYTIVSGNYLSIRNCWVESFNGAVDNMPNWTVWENVVSFQDKVGTAIGALSIPEDVEVSKDMVLTIPDGASVTVPAGKTFTNHGTINLSGTFTKEDAGTVICDSHTGGESTCTQAGKCAICGQEYSNPLYHSWKEPTWEWSEDGKTCKAVFTCDVCKDSQEVAAEVSAKETTPATCTQEGTTTYTAIVEFEGKEYTGNKEITNIPALGHHYENGKCIVCGDADPNYKPEAPIIISGADAVWEKDSKDSLIFTSNAEFSTFRNVLVDGKELDEKDYDIKEGSTVVTLKIEYLNTLAIGKHTLAIVSENGTAQTTFTITAKSVTESTSSDPEKEPEGSQISSEPEREPDSSQISSEPERESEGSQVSISPETESANSDTGNNNHIMLWIVILLVSGMGVAGAGIYSKNKKKEKHL